MADDSWQDPFETQEPHGESRKGMSTSMKVVLGLLIACGFLVLICCGGFIWLGNQFANSVTEDPAEIAKIQEEITAIEIPEGLPPGFGMSFNLGVMNMQMAGYGADAPEDIEGGAEEGEIDAEVLLLMQMQVQGQSDDDMRREFQQQAQQHGGEDVQLTEMDTRTFTINGVECDFTFAKGVAEESEEPIRQVSGVFPGRNGTAFLFYMVPEEQWDEERTVDIIQSLKQ